MKYTAKKRVAVHGHAALKIALAASVLIIAATFFGYNAARNSQNEQWEAQQAQQQQQIQTPGEQPVAAEPERLGVEGKVYLQVNYTKCGHMVETDVTDKKYVGMTREELENQFANAELTEFSKDKAVFLVETPSVCTLHYIVKYENGMLNIYQPQENQAEPTLYKSIEMDAVNDAALEEGVIFDSLEQVESYLENIES